MSKPNFTVGMARAFGRRPTREPVPFQQILPLSLKNSVSGKGERSSGEFHLLSDHLDDEMAWNFILDVPQFMEPFPTFCAVYWSSSKTSSEPRHMGELTFL